MAQEADRLRTQHTAAPVLDRRSAKRLAVRVPALASLAGEEFTAQLLNMTVKGAMLRTAAPLKIGSRFIVSSGTIVTEAIVVWIENERAGVRFLGELTDAQIEDQCLRSHAIQSWNSQMTD